jgi:hypothetical protein
MNRRLLVITAGIVVCMSAAGPRAQVDASPHELHKGRQSGWRMAQLVIEKLQKIDATKFPGIHAWLKELQDATQGVDVNVAPDKWPALDLDKMVTRNPMFWRAYYEIAPADPGLMLLHASLLLTAGEATRTIHLVLVAGQHRSVPAELFETFDVLLANAQTAHKASNEIVFAGNKLFDQKDFAGALKKHQEALKLWPQNGFAHYEYGLTLREVERAAAGEKPIEPDKLIINAGIENSPEVDAAFAKARKHDPFQIKAYQGKDQAVIRGFMAMVKTGLPAWRRIVSDRKSKVDDAVLIEFAGACQDARIDELALAVRQVCVARRGRYKSEDHPFITTSLKRLAPGKETDETLERLKAEKLELWRIVSDAED